MELWIARDMGGRLTLHCERPIWIANRGWNNVWAIPDSNIFPEVTFENSPKKVEIKLVEEL